MCLFKLCDGQLEMIDRLRHLESLIAAVGAVVDDVMAPVVAP